MDNWFLTPRFERLMRAFYAVLCDMKQSLRGHKSSVNLHVFSESIYEISYFIIPLLKEV